MLNGFIFKEFTIQQDRCAMKVGTDGVLLGAWARGGKRILDIGSGTGLIAMMMAQRFPEAFVEGVEIDTNAVEQSRENAERSIFASRLRFHNAPLQTWKPEQPFDAIVTNPPFFLNSLHKYVSLIRRTRLFICQTIIQVFRCSQISKEM